MSKQIKVTTYNALVVGKKVTIDLDLGYKYLAVQIKRTNFTAAQATNYALKVNGKIVQSPGALSVMEDLNTHYNRPQTAGVTTLFFNRPELVNFLDRDFTGIGTQDIKTLQIEFILDASIGAAVPAIDVVAEVVQNEPIGHVTFLETSDIAMLAIGKNVIPRMPEGKGSVLNYFMGKTTMDITDLVMTRVVNGSKATIIDSSKEFLEIEQAQAAMRPRVPVTASYTAIDFFTDGLLTSALRTDAVDLPGIGLSPVERVGLDVTVGSVEPITCITESVGEFTG